MQKKQKSFLKNAACLTSILGMTAGTVLASAGMYEVLTEKKVTPLVHQYFENRLEIVDSAFTSIDQANKTQKLLTGSALINTGLLISWLSGCAGMKKHQL